MGNIQMVPDEFEVTDWRGVLLDSHRTCLFEIHVLNNHHHHGGVLGGEGAVDQDLEICDICR
jgi:hypothetical protein